MENVVGRDGEKILISNILGSGLPELVAVYGRRRVGKTYFIRNVMERHLAFEISGLHDASLREQLQNFSKALAKCSGGLPLAVPETWSDAFDMLIIYLSPLLKKGRRVIFIDEFPWMSSRRSGFMTAFENFWNTWASLQKNLVVVICGSAAAWMIQKVLNNRGGLHNRVTRRIRLLPFTLGETEAFLKYRKINLDRYQILQLYMAMGGVPQYLKEVEPGESAMQAIDRICFSKDGLLHDEFKTLFYSLFSDAAVHTEVIKALAKKGIGLTRSEIIDTCKLSTGGGTTQVLDELTESGFITPYIPFGKTKNDSIYKLTDEYSHFYVKFIEAGRLKGAGAWASFSTGTSWKSWAGTAFESVCMKHSVQLKAALGIKSVHTEISSWRQKGSPDEPGIQIDLIIDRSDQCINICEMKFSIGQFEVTKAYQKELEHKVHAFRSASNTRKTLFLTMVTTHGVSKISNYAGLIQTEITMADLFS